MRHVPFILSVIVLMFGSVACSTDKLPADLTTKIQRPAQAMETKRVEFRASDPEAPSRQDRAITLRGRVWSNEGPVPQARVRIQGAMEFVTTDAEGYFTLPVGDFPNDQVPITVGKAGWFNTGAWVNKYARNVTFELQRVPARDDPNYRFLSPDPNSMGNMMGHMMGSRMKGSGMMGRMGMMRGMANCGNCHQAIYEQWKQSTMARSAQNPWVLDLYNGTDALGNSGVAPGYRLQFPQSPGNCADCHAPSAAVKNPGRTDLNAVVRRGGVDAQGIHCDFCHKIADVVADNRSGINAITLRRQEFRAGMMMSPVLAFGPYDDTVTMPMAASYNPLFERSEICAPCHQEARLLPPGQTWDYQKVYPNGDPEAFENGRAVPTQWTYQEWKAWQESLEPDHPDKGRVCQDCHMNWLKEMLPYSQFVVDGPIRQTLGVKRNPQRIHPHHFQGATPSRLNTAAHLAIEVTRQGNELIVTVSVTNANAGHRLPTGIWMRNLILLVTATDENGKPLKFLRGETVPAWGGVGAPEEGNYAGLPGKGFARVTADEAGNLNVPDWQAVRIVSDNRIPPKQTDTSTYVFEAPQDGAEPTVEARLIYRRAFKPLADAKRWKLQDIVMTEAAW